MHHVQDKQEMNGLVPQDHVSLSLLWCGEIRLSISVTCHNASLFSTLKDVRPVGSALFPLMKAGLRSRWLLWLKGE